MDQGDYTLLTIEAYDSADFDLESSSSSDSFQVMFNPEKYSRKYQIKYEEKQSMASTAKAQLFKGIKPDDFQLEFVLDGTGAAAADLGAKDVETKIKQLLDLTHKNKGSIHRTRYLKVYWGTFIARCVLSSVDANYTLFAQDGTALRAKVTCKFLGVKSDGRRVADDKNSSPDLSHKRLISREGRIDNYSFEIYKDPSYYLKVARFNGLKNFRRLRVGSELDFPPLKNESTS